MAMRNFNVFLQAQFLLYIKSIMAYIMTCKVSVLSYSTIWTLSIFKRLL